MGLPNKSAVRSIDATVDGLAVRVRAFLGDGRVPISSQGTDLPLAAEVDRIDTSIRLPRIAIIDPDLIPGFRDAHAVAAVAALAVDFYRHPDHYEIAAGSTPAAETTGSAP
ncbi:hypothetical protein [Glycomyces sp. MUSA5-2]|uniref:hypothetical protein n=1 Tax=Glycomyces sp. MUSA5-2 TaxID=2053002 RepID=UPI00300A9E2A